MDSEQPRPGQSEKRPQSPDDGVLLKETRRQVDLIGEEFLESLRRGEPVNREELVRSQETLAPHLENRLKVLEAVFFATYRSSGNRSTGNNNGSDSSVGNANLFSTMDSQRGDLVDQLGNRSTARESQSSWAAPGESAKLRCPRCGNRLEVEGTELQEVTCGGCGSTVHVDTEATQFDDQSSLPRTLGRFKVRRLLGQGAFGSVYLADDPKLSRQVAVKVPRRGYFVSRIEEQRFFREAKSAAGLRHANIVQVHEISDDPDMPYIVTEFVDGITLSDIASGTPITFREAVALIVQVANAVAYAHQNNIVHRDLKPGNILIDKNRNAFVADFGLARRDDLDITMTLDGVILGTPAYMSPEQASGAHGPVDPRSDIYSLGVILYRLLCRELPFHGTKQMVMHQVIHDEPRTPRRLNERIPQDLETITLKAMAKSPGERFSTAADLVDELQRWLNDEPIKSRPIGRVARTWRLCKRRPMVASLTAIVGLLVLAGSAGSLVWGSREYHLRELADNNAEVATENKVESDLRLLSLTQHNGNFSLARNELTDSAYWFANALKANDNRLNRTRLGMIQDRIPKLVNVWNLDSPLSAIQFNAAGNRVAAGTFDGKVRVYDRISGKMLLDQNTEELSPVELRIFPAGNKIVFNVSSNVVQIWDVDSNSLASTLNHPQQVTSIDVNGNSDIVTGCQDCIVRIFDGANGTNKAEVAFAGKPVSRTRFLPKSNRVLITMRDDGGKTMQTQVWDYQTQELVGEPINHRRPILPFDTSPDGKRLLVAAPGNLVKVVDIETGIDIGIPANLPNNASSVFFTDNGNGFATIDVNGDVSAWSVMEGMRTRSNFRFDGNPSLVVADADQQIIAVPGRDGRVEFFWRSTGIEACSSLTNGDAIKQIEFHPDGRQIAVGGVEGILQVWDLAGSSPTAKIFQHEGTVSDAIFASDGKRCLTISTDGNGFIRDVETGLQIGKTLQHDNGIYACDVSSDGQLFATASSDKTVKVWDAHTGALVGSPLVHDSAVIEVAIDPDGKRLITGSPDGTVTGWEINANQNAEARPVFTVKHKSKIRRIVFNATGDLFASASSDGMVRCWDAVTGVSRFGPFQHASNANGCEFLPDGKGLVTFGSNGLVYVWDLVTAEIEQQLHCGADVRSVIISDDGRILSNENPGVSRVWQQQDGKFALAATARNSAVGSSTYSQVNPALELLAVGGGWLGLDQQYGNRGAAFLWDLENDSQFCPALPHFEQVVRVRFNSTGTHLLTASVDKTSQLLSLTSNDLPVEDARRIAGLYAQFDEGPQNKVAPMSAAKQVSEYAELSGKYPEWFSCSADEIGVWDDHQRRIRDANASGVVE